MKRFFLALLFLVSIAGTHAFAGPPDIFEKSPDGKWLFKAKWFEDRGYIWELQNLATTKSYFATPQPADNEGLPHRLSMLWSPDHRYLAINFYYGRIVYGVEVVALLSDVPDDKVDWPRHVEMSMIKPEDRKMWDGSGSTNSVAEEWQPGDVLVFGLNMLSELEDKASGVKFRIDSGRKQSVKFTGLKGKVVDDQPPEYDKDLEK